MILTGSDILRVTTSSAATLTVYAAYTDHGRERSARGRASTAISSATTTTVAVLRAQSIADDIQVGVFANLATRPSTNVGSAQAYTIDGATATAPWFAVVV